MIDSLNKTTNRLGVEVTTVSGKGMISLRGDFKSKIFSTTVHNVCGVDIPAIGRFQFLEGRGSLWMSPDELLLVLDQSEITKTIKKIQSALKDKHFLVVDSSDARVIHQVQGTAARDVLAKLTPANMSPNDFEPGQVRRTRIGQVAAAIYMLNEETIQTISFRSTSRYVFDLLNHSARASSEVGFLQIR